MDTMSMSGAMSSLFQFGQAGILHAHCSGARARHHWSVNASGPNICTARDECIPRAFCRHTVTTLTWLKICA